MFYLIAAAMAALSAGDAPAQRVVKVAADYLSADFGQYGDADGDGVLERLGKFWKVYDYPEGTIPDPERDDRYCIPWGDSEYYRVKDGAAYYRVLPPDPAVSMATYYPQDREPDFSEGGYDFFRITSVGDARLWYAWMFPDEASAAKLVYHGGLLYTRSDTPAPTVDDARLTWIKPDGTLIHVPQRGMGAALRTVGVAATGRRHLRRAAAERRHRPRGDSGGTIQRRRQRQLYQQQRKPERLLGPGQGLVI